MSKHFNVAVEGDDGGLVICQGCKSRGTYTELPAGECPTPYKPDSVLLAESMAREQALQLLLNDRDEQLHTLEQSRRSHFENAQAAERRIDELTVPVGYCLMPAGLTAENGAKALLLGEFKLQVTCECPVCCDLEEPSEGCEICDGEGEYGQQHTIPWEQIKFIYSEAVKGLEFKHTPL